MWGIFRGRWKKKKGQRVPKRKKKRGDKVVVLHWHLGGGGKQGLAEDERGKCLKGSFTEKREGVWTTKLDENAVGGCDGRQGGGGVGRNNRRGKPPIDSGGRIKATVGTERKKKGVEWGVVYTKSKMGRRE